MRERSYRSLTALAWLSCLALACAKLTDTPSVGTNTNWLKACQAQDECGDGNSCLCGVCTRACSGDGACGKVHESTSCQPLTASACGGGGAASMACLQGCRSNAECTALEHGVCRDGLCVPGSDLAPDASTPSGPDGASAGPGQDAGGPMGTGFELSRDDREVVISDAYTECGTHADCVLASISCDGCCQQGAIAATLTDTYSLNFEQACAGYQGAICDCDYRDLLPRCDAGRCRAVERSTLECYSPTQNVDRAYDPELVGCSCSYDRFDSSICVMGGMRHVALFCTQIPAGSKGAWSAVEDGACEFTNDQTCSLGEIRASADACLAEFPTCYVLESGEYCGRP